MFLSAEQSVFEHNTHMADRCFQVPTLKKNAKRRRQKKSETKRERGESAGVRHPQSETQTSGFAMTALERAKSREKNTTVDMLSHS